MYGKMHAMINNAIPKPNLGLSSSNEPDIINNIAKNPKITGMICENIVVPTIAIFNHLFIVQRYINSHED